ncbi:hypothetical protein HKX48_007999 [Thoreauomyces humboldtii]|nr:hypothetical protein HKX48_007999 [Thoreauomyces humboldtii]
MLDGQPVICLAFANIQEITTIDARDIGTIWNAFTKCKNSLESGRRLENISWRLWHSSCQGTNPSDESLPNAVDDSDCRIAPSAIVGRHRKDIVEVPKQEVKETKPQQQQKQQHQELLQAPAQASKQQPERQILPPLPPPAKTTLETVRSAVALTPLLPSSAVSRVNSALKQLLIPQAVVPAALVTNISSGLVSNHNAAVSQHSNYHAVPRMQSLVLHHVQQQQQLASMNCDRPRNPMRSNLIQAPIVPYLSPAREPMHSPEYGSTAIALGRQGSDDSTRSTGVRFFISESVTPDQPLRLTHRIEFQPQRELATRQPMHCLEHRSTAIAMGRQGSDDSTRSTGVRFCISESATPDEPMRLTHRIEFQPQRELASMTCDRPRNPMRSNLIQAAIVPYLSPARQPMHCPEYRSTAMARQGSDDSTRSTGVRFFISESVTPDEPLRLTHRIEFQPQRERRVQNAPQTNQLSLINCRMPDSQSMVSPIRRPVPQPNYQQDDDEEYHSSRKSSYSSRGLTPQPAHERDDDEEHNSSSRSSFSNLSSLSESEVSSSDDDLAFFYEQESTPSPVVVISKRPLSHAPLFQKIPLVSDPRASPPSDSTIDMAELSSPPFSSIRSRCSLLSIALQSSLKRSKPSQYRNLSSFGAGSVRPDLTASDNESADDSADDSGSIDDGSADDADDEGSVEDGSANDADDEGSVEDESANASGSVDKKSSPSSSMGVADDMTDSLRENVMREQQTPVLRFPRIPRCAPVNGEDEVERLLAARKEYDGYLFSTSAALCGAGFGAVGLFGADGAW